MSEHTKTRKETLRGIAPLGDETLEGAGSREREQPPATVSHGSKRSGVSISAVVVKDADALTRYVSDWETLVRAAIEPNAFYEPWMLLPALKAFDPSSNVTCILIWAQDLARPFIPPVLCGFFPLEASKSYQGLGTKLPVKTLSLWKHPLCYLCTPLVRTECARECVAAFFNWLDEGAHGCKLMEFGHFNGDGPFYHLLVDYFNERPKLTCVVGSHTRGLFRPSVDAETYIRTAMPGHQRRELERHERRLAETGRLEYLALEPGGDVERWIEEFLQLEGLSWKGKAGRAMVSDKAQEEFFLSAAREGFRRGQLMMLALHVNGRPVANKCNFVAGPGSYGFKIAFDEQYARFSPGILLELENIRLLHARPEIEWMDSCADPDRTKMINRLCRDRRTIPYLLVGTGQGRGDFTVCAIPMLRWLNRKLRRRHLSRI